MQHKMSQCFPVMQNAFIPRKESSQHLLPQMLMNTHTHARTHTHVHIMLFSSQSQQFQVGNFTHKQHMMEQVDHKWIIGPPNATAPSLHALHF